MKKWLKIFAWVAGLVFIIWLITLNAGKKAEPVEYGYTFSAPYAQSLGLDWKKVYIEALDELRPKYVRVSAYWDEVEKERGKFNFDDLDFQVQEASARNVNILLAVGRRLPRWPECHDPAWINNVKDQSELDNAQLSYVETVVRRYSGNSKVVMWQVENEPFLGTFGICPKLNKNLLDSEIALVKKLDPGRPILITDSGELSPWWSAGARGDVFGSTYYRFVFSDVFKRYWTNHIPAWTYRFKAGLLRLMHPGKQIIIAELETEPWTTKGIPNTPIDEQFKTMSLGNFNTITSMSASTGFSPQYLWGVEWWYWMKQQGHPEFWDRARELME